jgi:hypothetical protein
MISCTIETNSLEQCPFLETDRSSATEEIHHVLWNPKVLYRIYKSLPPIPILRQIDPVHVPYPSSQRFILILFS